MDGDERRMTRYIDADALIWHFGEVDDNDTKRWDFFVTADEMREMSTVDAVPVRHGKWIIRDNPGTGWYRVTCSECGEDVTSTAPCVGFFPNAKVTWDYCPYCGLKQNTHRQKSEKLPQYTMKEFERELDG